MQYVSEAMCSRHNPRVNCKYDSHVHYDFKLLTKIIWNDPR